jgi:hypothetical protein
MTNADLHKVRSYLKSVEHVVEMHRAGAADEDALLEFRRWCWAALLLIDDAECQDHIDLLVQRAKELFRGNADGRAKVFAALAACRARLDAVEGGYGKRWRDLRAA